ncbi:MAG: NTF2 fold immunity protein [Bacteroidota bacterium]|nr:NTF2 fold immunity protein [Bacteroidota bacterium]
MLVSCNSSKDKDKSSENNYKPSFIETDPKNDGYIPNAATAIKIAKAIWIPLYGETDYLNKTFKTELSKDGVWKVYNQVPADSQGVELYAYINKMDGKIIKVYGLSIYKSEP